ncbi:MAG: hypothetical protein AAF573_08920 [Bacteroidota bacterium]
MTTNLISSLSFTILFSLFTISSFGYTNDLMNSNNENTLSDFDQFVERDTTPERCQDKSVYRSNKDGQRVYLATENGMIKKLKINGRKIPSSEYGRYTDLIAELQGGDVPTPPTTPEVPLEDEIKKAHDAIEAAHAEIEKAHREIERAHREIEKINEHTSKAFAEALLEDGLIRDSKNYRFKLSTKKFKVNGKKTNAIFHQKYLNLYEELTGKSMSNQSIYMVSHND